MRRAMTAPDGQLWTILPHGSFRVRVLMALIEHQWFVLLRYIFILLALLLLVVEGTQPTAVPRPRILWMALAVLALVNVAWTVIGRRLRRGFSDQGEPSAQSIQQATWFVNAQMLLDILILTVMLRYSGGVENPMAIFYLFHMLIAALLLKPLNAVIQGAWALILFAALAAGECVGWIAPHYPFVAWEGSSAAHSDPLYVVVSVGVLAAGVVGTLYFTLQISLGLDEQESELFEANAALRASKEAIERLQERRSRFLRTSAHQLKAPLTGIEMLAGLIRDGIVGPGEVSKTVGRIIQRCRVAITQVTELLMLERVEGAPVDRHTAAGTRVSAALGRSIQKIRGQVDAKGMQFTATVDCDAELTVAVDARDFEDCIDNLLDNAIKYSATAGGIIGLVARPADGGVRIEITDNGMGIASSSLESIFEPFHRGNEALAANIPGSGLGLTIVREIVEQARGRITVNSQPGQGSEFALWFPLLSVAERAKAPLVSWNAAGVREFAAHAATTE
jgi:signal transduction histidine kinase